MFTFVVIGILVILDLIVFIIATKERTDSGFAMFYFLRVLLTGVILITFGLILEDFRKEESKMPDKYEEVTETFYRKIE